MDQLAGSILLALFLAAGDAAQGADPVQSETIVLLRHGEKPAAGLGQLNCQGLNRALALPPVIEKLFGKPAAIFAPDPAQRKMDYFVSYDYVRPLATIEPTAISLGLPVDTTYGATDIDGLRKALEQPVYGKALLVVAWEHKQAEKLARDLLAAHGGHPDQVPRWPGDDFDSIYVVRIARTGSAETASFEHMHEGLDGQPMTCGR